VEREWRERVEKSEAEAAEWRAEAEDARSALDLSEKHAAALKDRQIQFEGQYREVSEQASGLEQALNSARTRLSASEQRAAQLEEELPGLRLAAEQLRTLEEQHEKDRNQAAAELASLESGKQDLAAQLSEARAALESREEDGIRARGDCESLRGEKQSLERQLSETRDALAGQEEAGHRFHAERESLLETKQGLETQLSEARSALDDLRQMEHGLRGDHESLEGEKCAIEERLAKTQAALEERERRLSDRESNIDALQNYVSELEGQAEQLRDRVQESVSAVDELRGTLDAMVATDLSRVAEIEANQRAIDGLKRDLVEHAGVVDLLTKRRSELEEAVAAFTSREEAARARLRRIEEQFERNSAEVRAKEDLIAELERNLSETRAAAQAEKERLEEKLSETMGTMDALLNVSAPEAAPSSGRIFVGSAGMGTDSASEAARLEAEKQCQRIVISERAHDGEAGRKLGRILADAGALTSTQVETALREQARSGELLGAVLARLEWASEEAIAQALSCQLGLPVILPKEEVVDADAAALFHRDVCLWHVFVPLRISGGKIVMAMANPLDESACKKAADLSRKEVAPVLATSSSIMAAIDDIYGIL